MPEVALDPNTLLMIGGVGGVVLIVIAVLTIMALRMQAGSRYQRRIALVQGEGRIERGGASRDPATAKRRALQQRLKEMDDQRKRKRKPNDLRSLMRHAGMTISMRMLFVYGALAGVVCVGGYLYLGLPVYGVVPVFLVGMFGLPRSFVGKMAKRRINKFTKYFAEAVDVIVRGVQSGLPVNECLNIIARESPEPVGGEFRQIVEGIKVGLTLNETMLRAVERMPTAEFRFFAVVLAIQQTTGGNLAETLGNLSGVLRDRKRMSDKIKSMTSEARMTATIIGSLPFAMCAILALTSPNYIGILFTDPMGHYLIGAGIVSMSVGVWIMQRMIAFDY
jgi:tight adherence protein B